ncbi:MAG: glycosyltransferase family 2 protein [Algibacter sp.]
MHKLGKISIITVCYNCQNSIVDTIESVLNQTCVVDIEYIIIDGKSTDSTINIIKSYEKVFIDKNIVYKWYSELDKGIYDAMNKGIKLASGQWLNFMNSGDTFVDNNVLSNIFKFNYNNLNIVYGDKLYNNKIIKSHPIKFLQYGIIMACHQSMFFNKFNLKEELSYNLHYPIYGDYELVAKIHLLNPNKIKYINFPISIYLGGGISSFVSKQKRKDKFKILFKYYGILGVLKGISVAIIEKLTKRYNLKGEN